MGRPRTLGPLFPHIPACLSGIYTELGQLASICVKKERQGATDASLTWLQLKKDIVKLIMRSVEETNDRTIWADHMAAYYWAKHKGKYNWRQLKGAPLHGKSQTRNN